MLLRSLSGLGGEERVLDLVWSPLSHCVTGSSGLMLQTPVSSQCHG